MKLKDLGDLGNMVAAAGVIVSLLILAWQVRLNTAALRAESNLGMVTLGNATLLWNEPEFAELTIRARDGIDTLNETETLRFTHYCYAFFNTWEQGFLLHRDGLMTDEQWAGWDAGMTAGAGGSATREVWSQIRRYYSRGFQDHVSDVLGSVGLR
jgi:hypothetical protein